MIESSALSSKRLIAAVLFLLLISATQVHAVDIELKSGCGLGQAIRAANTDAVPSGSTCTAGSGADTITLGADITRTPAAAYPAITSTMTIKSAEGQHYTISGNDNAHIFTVSSSSGKLTINNLIITDGRNSTRVYGGAIRVIQGGTLTLNNSVVKDSEDKNTVPSTGGGAILVNLSSLTLNNSTISGNAAVYEGGGIRAYNSTVSINNSTISGNSASDGGGIYLLGGSLTVNNSTIIKNSATGSGGGIYAGNGSTSTLTHVTLSENQAASNNGGGIYVAAGESGATFKLRNSIIANSAGGGDCVGTLSENINNLIEDGSCATGATNLLSVDPALGTLMMMSPAYFPLLDESPAIGAGAADHCLDKDQPGSNRPESACDIGAYENSRSAPATRRQPGDSEEESDDTEENTDDTQDTESEQDNPVEDSGQRGQPGKSSDKSDKPNGSSKAETPADTTPTEKPQLETCKTLPERFRVTLTHSGAQCQQLDARGIGIQSVIDAGFIAALDVWGYLGPGVEVCFQESGSLLFLDATTAPRTVLPLPSYIAEGMTCGWIDRPGSVVLIPGPASAPPPPETDPIETLQNCLVTTTDILNVRNSPAGNIEGLIHYDATVTAIARTAKWFKIQYSGREGWISADYVSLQGDCGLR